MIKLITILSEIKVIGSITPEMVYNLVKQICNTSDEKASDTVTYLIHTGYFNSPYDYLNKLPTYQRLSKEQLVEVYMELLKIKDNQTDL